MSAAPRVRLPRAAYLKSSRAFLAEHFLCECGCGRRSESTHHAVNRSQGGDDIEANWLAMDGSGTTGCHGAFTSKQRTWDLERGVYIDPIEVGYGLRETMETRRRDCLDYVLATKGLDFLERVYPSRPLVP